MPTKSPMRVTVAEVMARNITAARDAWLDALAKLEQARLRYLAAVIVVVDGDAPLESLRAVEDEMNARFDIERAAHRRLRAASWLSSELW